MNSSPSRQSESSEPPSASKKTPLPNTSRASFLVAAGIFLSRVSGFAREWVFARYLGNSDFAGVFRAAQSIPNFLQNLLGEGVLSASFIPVYARLLAEGREDDARKVAGAVASLLALVVSILVLLGILAAPVLTSLIVPGFSAVHYDLAVRLVRVVFPGTGILVMSAWCLGVLNSHRKFFLSYSVQVVMNATVIGTILAFRGRDAETLTVLTTWGATAGSFLIFAVQLPSVVFLLKRVKPSLDTAFEPVRTVIRNFFPVVVGRGVVQISAYVDRIIVSWLSPVALATLANAQNVYMLPVSLFGMSVSAAQLPEMSSVTGSESEIAAALRVQLESGLRRIAFFVVPSVVAFWVLGDTVVGALYQTGKFGRGDTLLVWRALAGSTVGLLAATMGRLYASTFYALRDTRTPLKFSILRVLTGIALGSFAALGLPGLLKLEPMWGVVGLTAASGIAGWVEFLLLRRGINRRIGKTGVPGGHLVKLWGAALAASALALGLKLGLPNMPPFFAAMPVLGLYGLAYLGLTAALGVGEAKSVAGKVLRRLK